ncbi:MAG: glycosyltransferase [Burkholderiaceae bacterium]|uniref:glycosyltransferase family 2 protein n=1 Tax=Polaromonas sp. YR568 TaxID=1855301 RepID=UPI0027157E6B|nr:glycosyltransferase [Burkholderiaceae bacterium]
MRPSISLVVPMLNEARTLPDLLSALTAQTRRPDELIFVDAGSADGSADLVRQWWASEGWAGLGCQVLSLPGAYPGAGRNAGVRAAQGEWIAFLDAGIDPDSQWLEQLERFSGLYATPGVFGVCRFTADKAFQRAICALSNGQGAVHPVVPASIFKREVFGVVGYFPENLRAAEDLAWVARYEMQYGVRAVCEDAQVSYRHFPGTWRGVVRKWQMAEYFSVLAGMRTRQQLVLLIALPTLYAALLTGTPWGVGVYSAYLLLRGVVDPIRRSCPRRWWRSHPRAIIIAIPLGAVLDVAKFVGTIRGWLARRRAQPECP